MCNKLILKNRIVEILELPDYSNINTNPLYYYGSYLNPLLFNGMAAAIQFLNFLKDKFGWLKYKLDYSESFSQNQLTRVKVTLSIEFNFRTTYLFLNSFHTYDLPIIPPFLYDIKKTL